MTNTDMQSFEVHGGLNTFINRLEVSSVHYQLII